MDTHDCDAVIRRNDAAGCTDVKLIENGKVRTHETYSWRTQYVSDKSALRSARSGARDLARRWQADIRDETRVSFWHWVRAFFGALV